MHKVSPHPHNRYKFLPCQPLIGLINGRICKSGLDTVRF
nr:MAG TPA: hypothetical protein [Caudoviricetes sp.]